MKYIRTYETATLEDRLKYDDVRDCVYWQVNAKQPYFSIALKKIGMPESERKYYINMINMFEDEDNEDFEILIFRTWSDEDESYDWTYANLDYKNPSYRKPPVFMGKVEVGDHEVEAEKYNL